MKLASKTIHPVLYAVALFLIVPLVGGLVGGLLLRTEVVQKRIGEAFSAGTGMVVKFESVKPGLWSARMKNLTATGGNGDSVSAKEVYVKLELLPLLAGKLVFREISFNGTRVVRIEPLKAPKRQEGAEEAAQDSKRLLLEEARPGLLKALRVLRVSEAAVDWQLTDGRTKLQLEGFDLEVSLDAQGTGSGSMSVLRGSWMEVVRFTDVRSELKLRDGRVTVEGLRAVCGEGTVQGRAEVGLEQPRLFSFQLEATDVDLEKMTEELPTLRLAGKARAAVQMEGAAAEEGSWVGTAKLQVEEGKFQGISLFQMLGQIFQIQEISNFRVKRGIASLRVAEKKIWVDEFNIDGGDLGLSAPGMLDFERNLALSAKLVVPERLLNGRVAQMLSGGFSAPDAAGLRSIGFQVGGTLDRPSTNLMEKVVGEGLGGVLNQLIGGFLKPKKTEKPESKDPVTEEPK